MSLRIDFSGAYDSVKNENERLKRALLDIHNHCTITPGTLETALITQECIEDILYKIKDIYLKKEKK